MKINEIKQHRRFWMKLDEIPPQYNVRNLLIAQLTYEKAQVVKSNNFIFYFSTDLYFYKREMVLDRMDNY